MQFIPGVGPRIAGFLAAKGIRTATELLHFFPYKYLDRRRLDSVRTLSAGPKTVVGKVLSAGLLFFGRRRIYEIVLADETGAVSLKWFHFYPQQFRYQKGMDLMVSGTVSLFRGEPQFVHPEIQLLDPDLADEVRAPGVIPNYSQVPGVGQKTLRKIIRNALELFTLPDIVPETTRIAHQLPEKNEGLRGLHFPGAELDVDELNNGRSPYHRREILEEFFLMELALALRRSQIKSEAGIGFLWSAQEMQEWLAKLPFTLTRAQKRVLWELLKDMQAPLPMNRLIQGDVGSGKTVVALLACLVAVRNGYQAAIMAPTEILAEQHFRTAGRLLAPFRIPIGLLTGSAADKTKVKSRIRRGLYPLVIGTHALIQQGVEFKKLGLAVIDEQHRFGVLQRKALRSKGNPDVLVMTATPIPRTLSMTLYGDLDLSIIDEMPPGRQPIQTAVLESRERGKLYASIREALDRGEQGYIIYPLVEESEKLALKDATRMFEELKKIFPKRELALLHGRIKPDEKEKVFEKFRSGAIGLLVATTVVEVGVDVPNATLMVIEHADRFGLSQLHQLRGRVGRGTRRSTCLLVSDFRKTEAAYRRLQVMCATQDGFRIAEEDLKLRGAGDFLGTRQAGLPEFHLANLLRDYPILKVARDEAFRLIVEDPGLLHHPVLKEALFDGWKERLQLAEVG